MYQSSLAASGGEASSTAVAAGQAGEATVPMACWNGKDKVFKDRSVLVLAEYVDQVPERSHISR